MAVEIIRIHPGTMKEESYTNMVLAAKAVERSPKSIQAAIKEKRLCAGYYWEKRGEKKVFEDWMIQYIKDNYKGEESIERIAKHIGLEKKQVRRKVEYLMLKEYKPIEETDHKLIDAKRYKDKIAAIKEKVHTNGTVKVKVYGEDLEEKATKQTKVVEAKVEGVYPCFFNVIINGTRRSYEYAEECMKVMN